MTTNSKEFIAGIAFMREIGISLTEENIPKIVAAGEQIARPSPAVGQILGFLESAVDAEYPSSLMEKLPARVDAVLERAKQYGNDFDDDRPVMRC